MQIDERTKINLFAAIGATVTICLFVFWFSGVVADARAGASIGDLYHKIDKRLDRIEIKLGTKPKNESE